MNFVSKTIGALSNFSQNIADSFNQWFKGSGVGHVANSGSPGAFNSSNNENNENGSTTDYNFMDYLEGLFSSAGAENEINRRFNSAEAAKNRDFQSEEAQLQRDWYEAMSSSAYSRAVEDMKKAGINPILAYQQGGAASAGTGIASGSAASYNAAAGDSLSDMLTSMASLISSLKGSSAKNVTNAEQILQYFIKDK